MARTWSPKKFSHHRQLRIWIAASAVIVCFAAFFVVFVPKTVTLVVGGVSHSIHTYAMSVDTLLSEQGVELQTHDQVTSASEGWLVDGDTVTVRKAYQVTLDIDGKLIPYWTVAKSAAELLDFFNQSVKNTAPVNIDITNVYNQLTGGLVIDHAGPVLVIWDGKQSIAPDGTLPVASILDSKAITLGKNDRVQIEKTDQTVDGVKVSTIMRVQRLTTRQVTRNVRIPFATQKVDDPTLEQGKTAVTQKGIDGVKTQSLLVTYVDGIEESEQVTSSVTSLLPTDQIIAVGTRKPAPISPPAHTNPPADANANTTPPAGTGSNNQSGSSDSKGSGNTGSGNTSGGDSSNTDGGSSENNSGGNNSSEITPVKPPNDGGKILHLTPSEAQSLAQGMMMDFYGWSSDQFSCLVTIWNHESGWRWNAENPGSHAYGIPQSLPGSKMGIGWHDDASVQISWGLSYIKSRYTDPCNAWKIWQMQGWY